MSVWDIVFDCSEQRLGDALVQLFRIDTAQYHPPVDAVDAVPHMHQFYELHVLSEGTHRYHIGEKTVPVRAGQLLIIKPGTQHRSVTPTHGLTYSVLGLGITRQGSESGRFYDVLTDCLNRAAETAIPLPEPIVERIYRYSHAAPSASIRQYCRRQLKACEIIISLMEAIVDEDSPYTATEGTDLAIMLDTFVSSRNVTLQEMAERLNYSPRHLSRIIKKRYGKGLRELRGENKV